LGLADELIDEIVSNTSPSPRQPVGEGRGAADLHPSYRPADTGNGFTGLSPTQPFWVTPALPAAEGTPKETRSAGPLLESVADTESPPAGPRGGVHALFHLDVKTEAPFPTNVFTVPDRTQNTGRRVNLPLPDCKVYVSDCQDLAVINELDGFNLQPRLSIPFDGAINVHSVNSQDVFLINLGDTVDHREHGDHVVGINQIVWDPPSQTLHVESDQLLDQHTEYALIVTNGLRDADGRPVEASDAFRRFRHDVRGDYKHELLDAIHAARQVGVREGDIVAASVFTTESATAVLEKIRDQIHAATPAAADFLLGPKGERTVFNLDDVTGVTWRQHTGFDADGEPIFNPVNLELPFLRNLIPGAVGELAFGKYLSPDYEVHPGEYIPPVGTRSGTAAVQGVNEIYFNLYLPSGHPPAGGWPVAIYGPGSPSNKNIQVPRFAPVMASHGIATIGINNVGMGFGPLGTLTVGQAGGQSVTFSAGGRGIDQDGDHLIGAAEGFAAAAPRTILRSRDGQRQTAADLMQLVRTIEVGMDVHGDGVRALDPSRIYFVGASVGAMFGTQFLAVEPSVRAGVLISGGGSTADWPRLSPVNRGNEGSWLAARMPSLLNRPGITAIDSVACGGPYFNDNTPLRNGAAYTVRLEDGTTDLIQSPVINRVDGAMAIQEVFENREWASLSGDALGYAPHLRRHPLAGMSAKSVLFLFAKADQSVPDPTATALLRAGDLADRATFYRHDLAYAEDPALPRDAHTFGAGIVSPDPLALAIARGAQEEYATFFESDGTEIIHPEPARFLEVPIQGPLPEELNYIPDP
jgi:hypothetical protein